MLGDWKTGAGNHGKPATTPGFIRSSGGLTMWFLDGLI